MEMSMKRTTPPLRVSLIASALLATVCAALASDGPSLDWRLGLGDTKGPLAYFGPEAMRSTNVVQNPNEVVATWRGHPECGEAFTVTVRWRRATDGLWSGDLAYEGYGGKRFVEEILFPSLSCGYAAGSSFVFGGHDSGVVHAGAAFFKPGARQRLTYCGGMQFSALVNTNGPSLYVDHRDPSVGTKGCEIEIAKEGGRLTYTGIHVPGLPAQPPAAYRISYASGFTSFKGIGSRPVRSTRSGGPPSRGAPAARRRIRCARSASGSGTAA